MPWIFNEDGALKSRLQGMKVTDVNAPDGRPVQVRFRLPESELGDLTFPAVIIDHRSVERDPDREHRGLTIFGYLPEGEAPATEDEPFGPNEIPVPYNIDYQVTVLSRKAVHHVDLIGQVARFERLPARFGALPIPQDGTVRRLDLLGGPELSTDRDADGKRLFTATYLIRVSTELVESALHRYRRVMEICTRISEVRSGTELDSYLITYDGVSTGCSTSVPAPSSDEESHGSLVSDAGCLCRREPGPAGRTTG
ncbi:hypothetical protein [Actinomadura atramentaria]|uniref:hypothetical protein n=1 Tax=Actinomadura atramentaria TaxID=1990 RepID=UPI0003A1DC92|nr:hypothetical protein [Actinomadura atramentaria]